MHIPMVRNMSHFQLKIISKAATVMTTAPHSTVLQTGNGMCKGPTVDSPTLLNKVCKLNQIPRFKITPTTAAVMPDKAVLSDLLPRRYSIYGAPVKMNKKEGR